MDHFAAFSFVDRITVHEPGTRARGHFDIPGALAAFPSCLVAEAVGQLAAWVAMAHVGYRARPVAALAPATRFLGVAKPGQRLDLAVDIDSCDDALVAYRGSAEVAGVRVLELEDCLGPMLATVDFDDPAALEARFALLTGAGAAPGRFGGVAMPRAVRNRGMAGKSAEGLLHIPPGAPFFNDHFPRRPVFPATLLLDAQIALALELVGESERWSAGTVLEPQSIASVKVRDFTPPGAILTLTARLQPAEGDTASVLLTAANDARQFATARLEIVPRRVA